MTARYSAALPLTSNQIGSSSGLDDCSFFFFKRKLDPPAKGLRGLLGLGEVEYGDHFLLVYVAASLVGINVPFSFLGDACKYLHISTY